MADFAQFVVLGGTDQAFRVPDNPNGSTSKLIGNFDLANLDPVRTVVVMFKVAVSGRAALKMTFNALPQASVDFTLTNAGGISEPRTWHEVVGTENVFKRVDNHLLIEVSRFSDNQSFMSISDIVIMYHATDNQVIG